MSQNEYIEQAGEEVSLGEDEVLSYDEFLEHCQENPVSVYQSPKYLLKAIEHFGKREVIENGEEMERWQFFDDPSNDGEHAIFGNTEILNEFVSDLRSMIRSDEDKSQMLWFVGPTACGKSEFKRCLINGLKAFAEEEEGQRYTIEWNIDNSSAVEDKTFYGDGSSSDVGTWYRSPPNVNPLAILPEETRENFVGENLPDNVGVETGLDPFSRESYRNLESRYTGDDDVFQKIISDDHLRVKRFVPEVGDGIGVLHAEDSGQPKEKLIGSWMRSMFDDLQSRGRKNPHAFSYDGLLCQGNSGISIVEDASRHFESLINLLNVCDEKMVKIDNKISMDIDTTIIVISNPDLEMDLNQYTERMEGDPLKALRRRLEKYEVDYLSSITLETQLLRKMLGENVKPWTETGEEALGRIREPMEYANAEISPHSIAAATMFALLTRVNTSYSSRECTEDILALDRGYYIGEDGEIVDFSNEMEEVEVDRNAIPVTFTRDVLSEMCEEQEVVMPQDVVEHISDEMEEEPVFSESEKKEFQRYEGWVEEFVMDRMEDDVLECMLMDKDVSEEKIRDYVEGVFAWEEHDTDNSGEDADFDAFKLKEFEKRYLGRDEDEYLRNGVGRVSITEFREEKIIESLNRYYWDNRDEDFTVQDIPLSECETLNHLLSDDQWDVVSSYYPNFDPRFWNDPPSGTETEELKEKTIEKMTEELDYTEESAKRASREVMKLEDVQNEVLDENAEGDS